MNYIRTILFNIAFFGGSLFWSIALQWIRLLPRAKAARTVEKYYFGYILLITKYIMNIKLELRGLENIPKSGSYILASKHQSAYETLILPIIIKDPAIILKQELTKIPLWGMYPVKMGMIAIDRGSASQALRSIIRGAKRVKAEERPILIFPQGTRTKPGEKAPYKIGINKLYKDIDLPILPVALNTGVFWGKNSFWKKSGTIVFEFLPIIPAGMNVKEAMQELETKIETNSDKLLEE